jgi:hypothetical protein
MHAKLATLLLASVIGLALVSGATARTARQVSGTYTVPNFGVTTCPWGGFGASSVIIVCTTTHFVSRYSGDLDGRSFTNFTSAINCTTGRTHAYGVEKFTGSLKGVGSGTLTWIDRFDASIDCFSFGVWNETGTGEITSATGDLKGLEGTLTFTDSTYDGVLH